MRALASKTKLRTHRVLGHQRIFKDGTPSPYGFRLEQEDIRGLPGFEEAFDVAATQVRIADLENKTGLDFGSIKPHNDFVQGGDPATLELEIGYAKPIRMSSDIVI